MMGFSATQAETVANIQFEFQRARIEKLQAAVRDVNRALQKQAGELGRSEQRTRELERENHRLRARIERLEAALGSVGIEIPA